MKHPNLSPVLQPTRTHLRTLLLGAALALGAAQSALAGTYVVNSTADHTGIGVAANCTPASCMLRDALVAANADSGSTITFNLPAPSTITMLPTGSDTFSLLISASMTIKGPGSANLTIVQPNSGENELGFLISRSYIPTGTMSVSISGITMDGTGSAGYVNGVQVDSLGETLVYTGQMSFDDMVIKNFPYFGFFANYMTGVNTTMKIDRSVISNNANGGVLALVSQTEQANQPTLTITNSTIAGNTGTGGIWADGTYIQNAPKLIVANSTIAGNTRDNIPRVLMNGACGAAGITAGGITNIYNSTITGNSNVVPVGVDGSKCAGGESIATYFSYDGGSGGIFLTNVESNFFEYNPPTTFTVQNSIIAGNTNVNSGGAFTNDYAGDGLVVDGTNITSGVGLNLAPLANNSSTVVAPATAPQTMLPLPGSTAICAGTGSTNGATTDQRGLPRTVSGCTDAGAVQTNYTLAFVQQPSNAVVNAAIAPAVTTQLQESGFAVTQAGAAPVTMAFGAGSTGTLGGTLSQMPSATGLATFADLMGNAAGTGDTLVASLVLSPTKTLTATSSAFAITATAATGISATATLPGGLVGTAYTGAITGAGGIAPYSYVLASGSLPDGLVLNGSTGAITGTPTVAGVFKFSITTTDSTPAAKSGMATKATGGQTVTQEYGITIIGGRGIDGGAASATPVPSLSAWSLVLLSLCLGVFGIRRSQRGA